MKPINYPKLSDTDLGIVRIGGPGLANCMFFAAKAYVNSLQNEGRYISPTWTKFSIGPYLRHERDKRVYTRLFKAYGISGFSKILFLLLHKVKIVNAITFNSLGDYFQSLIPYQPEIRNYFQSIINKKAITEIDRCNVSKFIAIHVRLGDYTPQWRIPIDWYVGIVRNILKENPEEQFLLFSDGQDDELELLTAIPNVKRVTFGNALSDIIAISRCKLLVASDSTFSAWGAFLGNVPLVFNRRHFPPVLGDANKEFVLGDKTDIPESLKLLIK